MARKKIREYDSKRLLKAHLKQLAQISLPLNIAQVNPSNSPVSAAQLRPRHAPGTRGVACEPASCLHISAPHLVVYMASCGRQLDKGQVLHQYYTPSCIAWATNSRCIPDVCAGYEGD